MSAKFLPTLRLQREGQWWKSLSSGFYLLSSPAAVASGKGRSGLGWFLIGLVFGIFALILVAVLPSPKAEAARHAELVAATRVAGGTSIGGIGAQPDRRACPQCGESIALSARVCRFCGHEMSIGWGESL